MSSQPPQQISGVYHRKIGDIVITALSDGYNDGNLELLKNVDVNQARSILVDAFRPVRRISINTFLVHTKEHCDMAQNICRREVRRELF